MKHVRVRKSHWEAKKSYWDAKKSHWKSKGMKHCKTMKKCSC